MSEVSQDFKDRFEKVTTESPENIREFIDHVNDLDELEYVHRAIQAVNVFFENLHFEGHEFARELAKNDLLYCEVRMNALKH